MSFPTSLRSMGWREVAEHHPNDGNRFFAVCRYHTSEMYDAFHTRTFVGFGESYSNRFAIYARVAIYSCVPRDDFRSLPIDQTLIPFFIDLNFDSSPLASIFLALHIWNIRIPFKCLIHSVDSSEHCTDSHIQSQLVSNDWRVFSLVRIQCCVHASSI